MSETKGGAEVEEACAEPRQKEASINKWGGAGKSQKKQSIAAIVGKGGNASCSLAFSHSYFAFLITAKERGSVAAKREREKKEKALRVVWTTCVSQSGDEERKKK